MITSEKLWLELEAGTQSLVKKNFSQHFLSFVRMNGKK